MSEALCSASMDSWPSDVDARKAVVWAVGCEACRSKHNLAVALFKIKSHSCLVQYRVLCQCFATYMAPVAEFRVGVAVLRAWSLQHNCKSNLSSAPLSDQQRSRRSVAPGRRRQRHSCRSTANRRSRRSTMLSGGRCEQNGLVVVAACHEQISTSLA